MVLQGGFPKNIEVIRLVSIVEDVLQEVMKRCSKQPCCYTVDHEFSYTMFIFS